MADFTWNVRNETGVSWDDVAAYILVFCGSDTDLSVPITVAAWQDGTHLGDGAPGTDQCPDGTNHIPNTKYISSTEMDKGAGTTDLTDGNLAETECTIQVEFTDASPVVVTNARLYTYDSTTTTNEAVGVDVFGFERGEAHTTWETLNDDSANEGGDNAGERMDLEDSASGTEHFWYIAITASPESVGAKGDFEFGCALTYS